MTTDDLKKKYASAEIQINDIYTNTKAVTVVSYQAKTQKKTDEVFNDLRASTTEYCDKEIKKIYDDSLEQLEEDFELEEGWRADPASEMSTVQNAKEDTESKLMWSIIIASMCLANYANKARMDNWTVNGFRESMLQQIADNGIKGSSFFRDGQIVQGGLSSYADTVLDGVDTMVGNGAVTDTLMANGWDLVKMSEHDDSCPICLPYQGRVYSLSGNSEIYPYLYDTGWDETYQNFHPNCRHYLEPFFPDAVSDSELAEIQAYSNRSYEIGGQGWTKEQIADANRMKDMYNAEQKRKRQIYTAKKDYEKYKAVLGDKAPKSFSGFWRMKQANSDNFKALKSEYHELTKSQ